MTRLSSKARPRRKFDSNGILVYDSLYGGFTLPAVLGPLLESWQLQRLRYVRLINVNSVPLSALGEVSRYTHTLGALRLGVEFLHKAHIDARSREGRLLLAALALHDAGTPAFGHSLEYVLTAQDGRSHVTKMLDAIAGSAPLDAMSWHSAPRRDPHGNLGAILTTLVGRGYEEDLASTLQGRGPLGGVVSSDDWDLDNVDNVFRMAHALGLDAVGGADAIRLAGAFGANSSGLLGERGRHALRHWAIDRRNTYDILNGHPRNVAGLAMLREVFDRYVEVNGGFREGAWWSVDGEVLDDLDMAQTRTLISRIKTGRLYDTWLLCTIDLTNEQLLPVERAIGDLAELSEEVSLRVGLRARLHVILDRGSRERRVRLAARPGPDVETMGMTSRRIMVSVHGDGDGPNQHERLNEVILQVLADWYGVEFDALSSAVVSTTYMTDCELMRQRGQLNLFNADAEVG
jgi:HD superfamily phosphohydrolase